MNIGIDLDGTLGGVIDASLPFINREMGTSYTVDELNYYKAAADILGDEGRLLEILDYVYVVGLVKPLEPNQSDIFDMIKGMGHTITIITKRTHPSHPAAISWIHSLGLEYDSLVFLSSGDKLNYPIDALVDDHPGVVSDARKHPDKHVFLFTQPWNREIAGRLPGNLTRISSLAQVAEFLKDKE